MAAGIGESPDDLTVRETLIDGRELMAALNHLRSVASRAAYIGLLNCHGKHDRTDSRYGVSVVWLPSFSGCTLPRGRCNVTRSIISEGMLGLMPSPNAERQSSVQV